MPTDEQIEKMLEAWYQLTGRRFEPSTAEHARNLAAMKRSLQSFEQAEAPMPFDPPSPPHRDVIGLRQDGRPR